MDRLQVKESMKKRLFYKNTQYDWLSNHILKPIKKTLDAVNLFTKNATEDYNKPASINSEYRGGKESRKPKTHKEEIKKRSEDNRIKDVRDHLIPKLENETKAEQSEILDFVLNQNLLKKIQTSKGQ